MDVSALLLELYGRIPPLARHAVEGLSGDQLTVRAAPDANTIAWLVWHLARVQDHHVSEIIEGEQIWATGEWAGRFGLTADASNTGYGHSVTDVGAVRPDSAAVLVEYLEAVDERTRALLEKLTPSELDRVVDRRWDPPVTLGVRLVSIADDCLQHVGQAAFARGMLGA